MEKEIVLGDRITIPRLGLGTWCLGERPETRAQELEALQAGIKSGVRLLDTAEMYGDGAAEELLGELVGRCDRRQLFLVSKVLPVNAGEKRIGESLDKTLQRLRTDYLDMYLLHWKSSVPLAETVGCMESFVQKGKIRSWGVSNFDVEDMEALLEIPGGEHCAVNQVLYHLGSRGIEVALLPWLEKHHIGVMAYCPLAQGGDLRRELMQNQVLQEIASHYQISVTQLLLLFVLYRKQVIAIPRSGKREHVEEICSAMDMELREEDMKRMDEIFPAPSHRVPLDVV